MRQSADRASSFGWRECTGNVFVARDVVAALLEKNVALVEQQHGIPLRSKIEGLLETIFERGGEAGKAVEAHTYRLCDGAATDKFGGAHCIEREAEVVSHCLCE